MGHLHLLGGSQLPHKTLGSMADKYGPIFTVKLGIHQALVVSDWEIAKECFTTNDKVLANRPKSVAVEHLGYNYAMFGLGPYGPYWRQVRKIVILELLSNRRLEMLGHVRVSQVKESIKEIYELWLNNKSSASNYKVKIEMKRWFGDLSLNMMVRMLVGKRYLSNDKEGTRFQKAIGEFFKLLGIFVVSDAIPSLRWLDLGGYEKRMKKTAKEIDCIMEGWLDEHKMRKRNSSLQVKRDHQDFMDVMLLILDAAKAEDFPGFDADTINKATCLAMLTGATDTTTVTLTWALSLLLNNRHVLRKAQDELDIHVGRERQLEESDLKKLIYIQAILKETLRLYPAGPLSVPHESMEKCTVGGYKIPKGTRLLVNLCDVGQVLVFYYFRRVLIYVLF
uniref:Cytochrome P450 CYP82D47-like n=1 Tax=Davidia involucrata TaxID=16924 RepID=A0A5B7BTW9_DAVIN